MTLCGMQYNNDKYNSITNNKLYILGIGAMVIIVLKILFLGSWQVGHTHFFYGTKLN